MRLVKHRGKFVDRAIGPVTKAYLDTCSFLQQENAIESGGPSPSEGANLAEPEGEEGEILPSFGGAKVGDLIQWESQGQLQFETPMRVRWISDDGQWLAIERSNTGIPMHEVTVQSSAPPQPPTIPIIPPAGVSQAAPKRLEDGESEWIANKVGKSIKVRLLVSGGEMGPKEIGKLITLLQAQQAVLEDEED